MQFGMMMGRMGVRTRAVSTPASVGSSCDLSVRFPKGAFGIAERVLSLGEFLSFRGFFEL